MFALNLGEDGRILSATLPEYAPPDAATVEELPDGDISNYRLVDAEYVYDPLPAPELGTEPEQPVVVDYAAEIQALKDELAATKILLGVE